MLTGSTLTAAAPVGENKNLATIGGGGRRNHQTPAATTALASSATARAATRYRRPGFAASLDIAALPVSVAM